MIEEEKNPKVHHMTAKAARKALAHRQISQESYRALLRNEITLQRARELGRDRGPSDIPEDRSGPGTATERARSASAGDHQDGPDTPPQPVSRISKDDTTQLCWCGCGQLTSPGRMWRPGHDARGKGIIKRAVREGTVGELPDLLKEYGAERGLL